jgi:hypothetical protein
MTAVLQMQAKQAKVTLIISEILKWHIALISCVFAQFYG